MSDNFINQVTLDCLVNQEQYNKHLSNQFGRTVKRTDKKFYRKRIYNLTKELLLSKEEPPNLFPDVKCAFDHFVNTCVQYFKSIDNNDIIQADYESITSYENIKRAAELGSAIPELNVDDIHSQEQANQLLMRTIQIKSNLDGFVTKKHLSPPEKMILPKQKEVNLKEPSLKLKGVCNLKSTKKKNIHNKYEENNKKETKQNETKQNETDQSKNKEI